MANYYSPCTFNPESLPFTREECQLLRDRYPGLEFELAIDDKGFYLYSSEGLSEDYEPDGDTPDELPSNIWTELDVLRRKYNIPFIQVVISYYCDKMRPGSTGGWEVLLTDEYGIEQQGTGKLLSYWVNDDYK